MKRVALALPGATAHGAAGSYRVDVQGHRTRVFWRQFGELAPRALVVMVFSSLAIRIARDYQTTGHVTGLLLLVSESLVVALTLVRRNAGTVDRSWKARILTGFSTFGPSMVSPVSAAAFLPETVTVLIAAAGIVITVCGKLSLGRSFGLAPANRGVVCTGLYRFARHPIYLGYLITHLGFVLANPVAWNLVALGAADLALMFRAVCEEQTLAADGAYRAYMQRVRWRIVPGVF
jgi:protein-S-isoprenylcysteine O-methyltransferase Ste14